ncbi:hypothetical protein ABZW44_24440 [Streptomyces mirabilis]|uniref:hypothetical protein n=1 Tax=Streptomyces mirabilis TaxID=68239 RepID=UPI0033B35C5B
MTDDEELFAADLIGERLLRVTTAWHHYADGEPSLLHLWLHLEGLGPVHFHTPGTGLSLTIDQPDERTSRTRWSGTAAPWSSRIHLACR